MASTGTGELQAKCLATWEDEWNSLKLIPLLPLDQDGDGDSDLLFFNGSGPNLLRNDGDGFVEISLPERKGLFKEQATAPQKEVGPDR